MLSLIDVHTHMENMTQVEDMLKAGIVATCDVDGLATLIDESKQLKIVTSAGIA